MTARYTEVRQLVEDRGLTLYRGEAFGCSGVVLPGGDEATKTWASLKGAEQRAAHHA